MPFLSEFRKKKEEIDQSKSEHNLMQSIFETLQDLLRFNQFIRAINETNYWEIFNGKGPFTVFAPNDDAFERLPDDKFAKLFWRKDTLADIISQHVVVGRILVADLKNMDEVTNLNNMSLVIEDHNEGLIIGGAKIVNGDIECTNGIIQEVDVVLLP
jgi:uncharacterized surface protein with fasciclin (FAS1) repeats